MLLELVTDRSLDEENPQSQAINISYGLDPYLHARNIPVANMGLIFSPQGIFQKMTILAIIDPNGLRGPISENFIVNQAAAISYDTTGSAQDTGFYIGKNLTGLLKDNFSSFKQVPTISSEKEKILSLQFLSGNHFKVYGFNWVERSLKLKIPKTDVIVGWGEKLIESWSNDGSKSRKQLTQLNLELQAMIMPVRPA